MLSGRSRSRSTARRRGPGWWRGGRRGAAACRLGRRVAVSGSAMEVSGTGSSPERWYLTGSLAPGVARLVLELSDGTRIGVPAMGSELADAGQRKWFAVVLD